MMQSIISLFKFRSNLICLLCCAALFVQAAYGQSAVGLFNAAQAAHGGDAALKAVKTIRIKGHSVIDKGAAQPISISASLDGQIRLDYGQLVTRSIVTTNTGHFEVRGGRKFAKPPHDGAFAQLDMLSVFGIQHLAGAKTVTYTGAASIVGTPTQRVHAATGQSLKEYNRQIQDEADVDFDAKTNEVAAITRQQFASDSLDRAFRMMNTFSNYKTVNGLSLPFRIDRYVDDRLRETITIDSIEINPVFPSTLFLR
jgi:hypothetical protein